MEHEIRKKKITFFTRFHRIFGRLEMEISTQMEWGNDVIFKFLKLICTMIWIEYSLLHFKLHSELHNFNHSSTKGTQ